MLKKILFIAVLALIITPLAQAQDYDLELLVGPHAGYQEAIDGDDGNFVWGGFLRFKPFNWMGVEAAADVIEDSFLDEEITADNVSIMGNVLFYPIPDIMYLSAGAGAILTDINFDDPAIPDEDDTKFAWNAGVGFEIPVMEWLSLTADARYVFFDLDLSDAQVPGAGDINSDFWMVRGGIALHFGGGNGNDY